MATGRAHCTSFIVAASQSNRRGCSRHNDRRHRRRRGATSNDRERGMTARLGAARNHRAAAAAAGAGERIIHRRRRTTQIIVLRSAGQLHLVITRSRDFPTQLPPTSASTLGRSDAMNATYAGRVAAALNHSRVNAARKQTNRQTPDCCVTYSVMEAVNQWHSHTSGVRSLCRLQTTVVVRSIIQAV